MATIISRDKVMMQRTAYHAVRCIQASIARYRQFGAGDLIRYLDADSVHVMAERLANKYFHRSESLQIFEESQELFQLLIVMAPILQRIPGSWKIDWHRGHVLGWLRTITSGHIRRRHFSSEMCDRVGKIDILRANLNALGVQDNEFSALMVEHYRRHAEERTVRDKLAWRLLDPVLFLCNAPEYGLRIRNTMVTAAKVPFPGSIDVGKDWFEVLDDYRIRHEVTRNSGHLLIELSDRALASIRTKIKSVVECKATPEYKYSIIRTMIDDFVEVARWARSGYHQVDDLARWMRQKLSGLAAVNADFSMLPAYLRNRYLQRSDTRLYRSRPNFFWRPEEVPEPVWSIMMSPYREG